MVVIYNTLTKKKEKLILNNNKIKFFVCGITPYDYAHLGHAKTYVQFDIIVKYLRYKGFNVNYLQNVTDIDDKIILRAKALKTTWNKLSRKYEKYYIKDMENIGVNSVNKYSRATSNIKEMISQVERLLNKGYAYKIKDGIYFDISKFPRYGKLAGRTLIQAEDAVSRIDSSKEKRNKGDFCLWKFSKPNEPSWKNPFGKVGRPGWHIEDTAITEKYFGQQYDMHGGAIELIFPHHEAEVAQMESLSNKRPFVKYWLHTGILNVNNRKMSKSLGNFITIKDILKKYDAKTIRFFFASSHYRNNIDFSEELIQNASQALKRIQNFYTRLKYSNNKESANIKIDIYKKEFFSYMDNDFNTPNAFSVIFDMIKYLHKIDISTKDARIILRFLEEIDSIFNILEKKEVKIPKNIWLLMEAREKARKKELWKQADEIRSKILEKGYIIEDTEHGPLIISQ